ncbi:MAG: glycosyltransferase family 39 protein [Rhodospirillales bacterium]|nr:glycosyltransferase family 39 protein [Rhodospirillales bacterium]
MMPSLMSLPVVLLEVAACVGFGAVILRLLNIGEALPWGERAVTAFIIGMGIVGWLLFFLGAAGLFTSAALLVLLVLGAAGLVLLGRPVIAAGGAFSLVEKILLGVLFIALALDVLEGLSPPADADSMAYHFAFPKLFLQQGGLTFIPRAVDGAIPLLLQMTYIPALGLGGEQAMTLWTMVSGWAVAWALYFLCRRFLERPWSLALTLIWLTTPVVLYGGGSGQIEVRSAGFVIIAAGALIRGRESGLLRYAVLAGLAAGLFVGAKYTGLLFATACGAACLTYRRRVLALTLFSISVGVIGFQWYFWNWFHTGDPVFPVLYGILDYSNPAYWDAAHNQAMRAQLFSGERSGTITLLSSLLYPFLATFATSQVFDSERAGLGMFALLVLPFALAGVWRFRKAVMASALLPAALTILIFYGLWFFSGSSQRVRHLLPIYPVAMVLMAVSARRWAASAGAEKPLYLALMLSLGLQMAGHGASSLNYARHVFSNESKDAFLLRNLAGYQSVQMINGHLGPSDKIFISNRQLSYYIDVPYYYANISFQAQVNILPEADDPALYYRQLRSLGVNHILSTVFVPAQLSGDKDRNGSLQWRSLVELGCAQEIARVGYRAIMSRSLADWAEGDAQQAILRLGGPTCKL